MEVGGAPTPAALIRHISPPFPPSWGFHFGQTDESFNFKLHLKHLTLYND